MLCPTPYGLAIGFGVSIRWSVAFSGFISVIRQTVSQNLVIKTSEIPAGNLNIHAPEKIHPPTDLLLFAALSANCCTKFQQSAGLFPLRWHQPAGQIQKFSGSHTGTGNPEISGILLGSRIPSNPKYQSGYGLPSGNNGENVRQCLPQGFRNMDHRHRG